MEAGLRDLESRFPSARRSELLRFLKARRGNVAEASSQYEQHLAWRAETLPVPYEDVSAVLESRVIYELPGAAHDGSSVLVFNGPNHDPKRFATAETLAAIVHVATTAFGKRGDPDDMRFTLILFAPKGTPFDLSGIAALASVMSKNFPETMTSTVVFPCGRFTSMLWSMAKHFLDPRTAAKVRLLVGGGRCPPQLAEIVPVDILPPEFSGEERSRTREGHEEGRKGAKEGHEEEHEENQIHPIKRQEGGATPPYLVSCTFLVCGSFALLSDLHVCVALVSAASAAAVALLFSCCYSMLQRRRVD